jgi:hypothetical protein
MRKKFAVYGKLRNPYLTEEFILENMDAAVAEFKNKNPDYEPLYVLENPRDENNEVEHEIIGWCESSGRPIFEGMPYKVDSEGVMWLED